MTVAEVFGLAENPFEPTGAAVGKYRFIPPANFEVLEEWIKRASIERKLYVMLVNSPHGAGKSALMEELRQRATGGAYFQYKAPVILVRLADLSIEGFVSDVLHEARPGQRARDHGRGARSVALRRTLAQTLMDISQRHKFLLWIIDEFDVLIDRPKQEAQQFLQFLRDVVDDLATKDLPIALLMSHTKFSSRDFEIFLEQTHGPFKSRIVATVPLGYSFAEVKEIVASRLNHAASGARKSGDISPFTEESLQTLFSVITSMRGMQTLDNFRVFERCCHFALIRAAESRSKDIDDSAMKQIFREFGLREVPLRESRPLSMESVQAQTKARTSPPLERNELILRGLLRAISLTRVLGGVKVDQDETSYLGPYQEGKAELSALSCVIQHSRKSVSLTWVIATSAHDVTSKEEVEVLLDAVGRAATDVYAHLRIFSYVSVADVGDVSSTLFDRVLWISTNLAEELAGLSAGSEEDTRSLIQSFDAKLAPYLADMITRETRDLTGKLSASGKELVETLCVMHNIGPHQTKDSLRDSHKRLFTRAKTIQAKFVREIIQLGFAEEKGVELIPREPRAHQTLQESLKDGSAEKDRLEQRFRSLTDAVLGMAMAFGLAGEENGRIVRRRVSDYERDLEKVVIGPLRDALGEDTIRQTEPGQRIGWLLDALEKSKKGGRVYDTSVVLTALKDLGPTLLAQVASVSESSKGVSESATARPAQLADEQTSAKEGLEQPLQSDKAQEFPSKVAREPLEVAITQILLNSSPLTLNEIEAQLREAGYEQDIRSSVFGLIMSGKVRITVNR